LLVDALVNDDAGRPTTNDASDRVAKGRETSERRIAERAVAVTKE
jgi:hypothetical protein